MQSKCVIRTYNFQEKRYDNVLKIDNSNVLNIFFKFDNVLTEFNTLDF